MHTFVLAHLSDETLLAELAALVDVDRQTTAALLAHIAEVDARQLYLPAACSSMHQYCVRILRFSEDAAFKRIRAARAARKLPQIFGAVAQGLVSLTAVVLLAPHLTDDNVDEVLVKATHRTKTEIEILVATLAPRPDVPTRIEPVAATSEPLPLPQVVPEPPPDAPPPAPRMKPLSAERFGLQVTISRETRDKLDRATALMRHRNPSGDVAEVLDRAFDALLEKLEREKFGKTSRPRAKGARPESGDPRYISSEVKRAVHARDGEQCTFVSKDGVRCTERGFLELDHRTPVALGGKPTTAGTRMLCRAHNQYEAERLLGADFMRAKRNAAHAHPEDARALPVEGGAGPPNTVEADVTLALRTMGWKADETRKAMAATAHQPAPDFESRIRAALAALRLSRGSRCSEGGFDFIAVDGAFAMPTLAVRQQRRLRMELSVRTAEGRMVASREPVSRRRAGRNANRRDAGQDLGWRAACRTGRCMASTRRGTPVRPRPSTSGSSGIGGSAAGPSVHRMIHPEAWRTPVGGERRYVC
jgi:hypothetical protein